MIEGAITEKKKQKQKPSTNETDRIDSIGCCDYVVQRRIRSAAAKSRDDRFNFFIIFYYNVSR